MPHFLLSFHPEFREEFEKWLYAWDHLHAEVYGQEEGDVPIIHSIVPGHLHTQVGHLRELSRIDRDYLIQKDQGELNAAFDERRKISSYTPHFPFAVSSLVGMFFDAQGELTPQWEPEDATEGLESSFDRDVTGQLEDDFDGKGNSLESWLWDTAIQLTAMGTVWPRVEGVVRAETEDGQPSGEVIEEAAVVTEAPLNVENWLGKNNRLKEVKLRTLVDDRDSIRDVESEAREIRHIFYEPGRFTQHRLSVDNSARDQQVRDEIMAEGEIDLYRTASRREQGRILPIFRVDLPLRGNPGYNSARDANTIFNLESALDFELWYSSFAKFFADVEDEDGMNEELWDEIKDAFREGHNLIPGSGHEYASPPSDNASIKMERLEQRIESFYKTFFQRFGDKAKEQTATEVKQEARSGVQAFLTLLAYSLENLMSEVLWRLEQIYLPETPSAWGQATWTADKDFDPVDVEERVDQLVERTMPMGKVPVTASIAEAVIRRWADTNDIDLDEDELQSVADTLATRQQQASSIEQDFGLGNQ